MATDPTALLQLLQPLLLGSKTKTTNSVPGNVTADFNAILAGLMPNVQNSAVTQQDLDALLQSVFAKGQQAFAPNQAVQASSGGYNSTSLEALKNDAMAKAINESIAVMLQAKLQGAQQQTQAGQVAGQVAGQLGQLTSSQTQVTPPALGGLAQPAMLYSLYKLLAGSDGAAGKTAGAAQAGVASVSEVGQSAIPSLAATPSITPTFSGGSNPLYEIGGLSEAGSGIADLGTVDYSMAFATPSLAAAPGITDFGATMELAGAGSGGGLGAAASSGGGGGMYDLTSGTAGIDAVSGASSAGSIFSSMGDNISNIDWLKPTTGQWAGLGLGTIAALADDGKIKKGEAAGIAGGYGGGKLGAAIGTSILPGVGTVVGGILGSVLGSKTMGKLASKCYITTATMAGTGNSDDNSYELTTMRKFRDEFMAATPVGQELIQDYYDKAPAVVAAINARKDAGAVYAAIYDAYLEPAVRAIEAGDNYRALTIYREMSQAAEKFAYSQATTAGA